MNYAQQLELEAHELARRKLIRAGEGTRDEAKLPGWLARLDAIHARNMELAATWAPPVASVGRMQPPFTRERTSDEYIAMVARKQAEEATEDPSNAR